MYKLLFHSKAKKAGNKKLAPHDRKKVIRALKILRQDPLARLLNIEKLRDTKQSFRLRIGNVRVIYELDTRTKVIYINELTYRTSTTYH